MATRNNKKAKATAKTTVKFPKDSLKTTRKSYRKNKCVDEIFESEPCQPCEPQIFESDSCEPEMIIEAECSESNLSYEDRAWSCNMGLYSLILYFLIFIIIICAIYYAYQCYKSL